MSCCFCDKQGREIKQQVPQPASVWFAHYHIITNFQIWQWDGLTVVAVTKNQPGRKSTVTKT